jgi:hypothetical protein
VVTVDLIILLHGITAAPYARISGRFVKRQGECEENRGVAAMPLRDGSGTTHQSSDNSNGDQ